MKSDRTGLRYTLVMNEYRIDLYLESDPSATESIKVKCNNVPCAVQKAIILAQQKTRKKGWKYRSHRLVARAWDSVGVSQAEIIRQAMRTGRFPVRF